MAQSHEFNLTIPEGTVMILAQVARERVKQNAKWGEQNHPPIWEGNDLLVQQARMTYETLAERYRRRNDNDDPSDWASILFEEAFEAFAEEDPALIRAELVQVAAVAVAAIDSLDRNELSQ